MKLLNNSSVNFILAFILIFIFTGFVTFTPDWSQYENILENNLDTDIFFAFIRDILYNYIDKYKTIHLIFTGIYTFLLLFLISKFSKNALIISIIYIPIVYLFYTTQIRYFLGYYSICLAFYFFYLEKKLFLSLLLVIFGLLNHTSLILFLPFIYFFKNVKGIPFYKVLIHQYSEKSIKKRPNRLNKIYLSTSEYIKLRLNKTAFVPSHKKFLTTKKSYYLKGYERFQNPKEIETLTIKILFIAAILFILFSISNILFDLKSSIILRFGRYLTTELSSTLLGGIFSFSPFLISFYLIYIFTKEKLRVFPSLMKDQKFLFLYLFSTVPYIFFGIALYIQIVGHRIIYPSILFQILLVFYLSKNDSKYQRIKTYTIVGFCFTFFMFYIYMLPLLIFNSNNDTIIRMLNSNTIFGFLLNK